MKNLRDAAVIALVVIIIKLMVRLVPPAERFMGLFEDGIWVGLGIVFTSYIVIFVIVYLVLLVIRRRKKKD